MSPTDNPSNEEIEKGYAEIMANLSQSKPLVQSSNIKPIPEVSENLVKELMAFKQKFGSGLKLIYYPCCGTDVSVSQAFPESRIIYVDQNEEVVTSLKEAGFEAYDTDVREFKIGEQADMVLIMNPQVPAGELLLQLKEKGYVICNNYHHSAKELMSNKELELLGVVDSNGNVDMRDLEQYWQKIETEEEFQNIPDYIKGRYIDVLKVLRPGRKDMLAAYKEILAEQKGDFFREYNGKSLLIEGLPKKKGEDSDVYIFRKK
ncbi:MAG TPA: hypothetical protein VJH63_01405 [Candidatus Paceibacterota bacterium]